MVVAVDAAAWGERVVQRFVAEKNIQHFNMLLEGETDESRRAVLQRMIHEEEAKLAELPPQGAPAEPGQAH